MRSLFRQREDVKRVESEEDSWRSLDAFGSEQLAWNRDPEPNRLLLNSILTQLLPESAAVPAE